MSLFFDDTYDAFDYELEKKKFIDNVRSLKSMSVEEHTLYKKWQENLQYKNRYDSSLSTKCKIWTPTDIHNKAQTIGEIENLKPRLVLAERQFEQDDWLNLRIFVSSAPYQMNPGRMIKYLIVDENTDKYLGLTSIGSDVAVLATRDKFIGWTKDDKFVKGKLNNTAIATTIVPTQPFGYNFLGGKLAATMLCIKKVRDDWKRLYGDTLVAITTTSLYGQGSMYNGIPYWKSLGESTGKILILPNDTYYDVWHNWVKTNRAEEYNRLAMKSDDATSAGPVTGVKQKILTIIMRELKLKASDFIHGYQRGVYFSQFYINSNEFLKGLVLESDLVLKSNLQNDLSGILDWWKPKAINRYIKLFDSNMIKDELLYYNKSPFMTWEETKSKFLTEVGR